MECPGPNPNHLSLQQSTDNKDQTTVAESILFINVTTWCPLVSWSPVTI